MGKVDTTGIYQKPDGYWAYRFAVVVDGKKICRKKCTDKDGRKLKTKSDAAAARDAAIRALRVPPGRQTPTRCTVKTIFEEFRSKGRKDRAYQTKQNSLVPTDSDYVRTIGSHMAWEASNYIQEYTLSIMNQQPTIAPPFAMKEFPTEEIFTIEKVASYDKEDLVDVSDGEQRYDYITRTAADRGICASTGYIGNVGLTQPNTFSLGLLQMTFFFREHHWYAGQFMRKITCKYPLDRYTGLYLETVLQGLSQHLSSGLVRDVDSNFYSVNVTLPVTECGEIDFEWMRNYVQRQEKMTLAVLLQHYADE